jgi:S-adenosylmethionine synthetase
MHVIVDRLAATPVDEQAVEIVERKGLGHPDSICDALAEGLSLALCRFYHEHFGAILHHNVDKALLWGGVARPAYGGGRVLEPMALYLSGRAVQAVEGMEVPVARLAEEGSRQWLAAHLPALDPDRHVAMHCLVRPGSADLSELFRRQRRSGVWYANDTSCGVGYAPLSELEHLVLEVEQGLNAAATRAERPELGPDVKVMGVRRGDAIHLTVACAFVDRHVADLADYLEKKRRLAEAVAEIAGMSTGRTLEVAVNAADDPGAGSIYLTVTGTSAEAGDDGEAGRGNRANGLITPCRPMTLESPAGKNPMTHVGKLYNIAAGNIAHTLVQSLPEVTEAQCYLVSEIGAPVSRPATAQVRLRSGAPLQTLRPSVQTIVREELDALADLWRDLLSGKLALNRWPLRRPGA